MKIVALLILFNLVFILCTPVIKNTTPNHSIKQKQEIGAKKIEEGLITFSNNSGTSMEDAIIVKGASNMFESKEARYGYLNKKYGVMDVDWKMILHLTKNKKRQLYSVYKIELIKENKNIEIYFNVTETHGKF